MKKLIQTSLLLAILASPGEVLASANIAPYARLNDLLKDVHKYYRAKNFAQIEEIRPLFLKEYDDFNHLLEMGSVKIVGDVQRNDLKLAKNYYSSLTTYYSALQKKYGYTPKEVSEVSNGAPSNSLTQEPLMSQEPVKENGIISVISGKMIEGQPVSEELITRGPQDFGDVGEVFHNAEFEDILNKEIADPIDEKKWDQALDQYYSNKYGKKSVNQSTGELPPPIPEEAFIPALPQEAMTNEPQAPIAQEKEVSKDNFEAKVSEIRKSKIHKLYQEESKVIDEGLKKIKILKENQARFQMKVLDQSKNQEQERPVPGKPKAKPPVFTHDRLSEDDDDVIIIKFQRNGED